MSLIPEIYVADYGDVGVSQDGGLTSPEWFDDTYATPGVVIGRATSLAYLKRPGRSVGEFMIGDSEGRIFAEDASGDTAFIGDSIVVPGHQLYADEGGAAREGHRVLRAWLMLVMEDSEARIRVWAGDEYAYPSYAPSVSPVDGRVNVAEPVMDKRVRAGRSTKVSADALRDLGFAPRTVYPFIAEGDGGLAGRGHTYEIRFRNPKNVRFIGIGGSVELVGDTQRRVSEAYVI